MRVEGETVVIKSVWFSLAWKEWHEHKWKLAAIVAVLVGVSSSVSLLATDGDRFGLAVGMLFLCTFPLAFFLGLGAAASERARGTLPFLHSLPVPLWRIALTKLVAGLLTIVVSVALTMVTFPVWQLVFDLFGVRYGPSLPELANSVANLGTGSWYLDFILAFATLGASVFLWSAATGVNRKDEVSAGAMALAVTVGWYLVLFAVGYAIIPWGKSDLDISPVVGWIVITGLSTAPFGFAPALEMANETYALLWPVIITAVVTHLALATWYVCRFGKVATGSVRSPQAAVPVNRRLEWLGPPRRSAFSALAWKQFRESGTIAFAGLVGIVGTSLFIAMFDSYAKFQEIYATVSISLGFCIALVAGIGIVLQELIPQLNNFWRSRPINPDLWFWTKFATGLAVVVLAIYVPLALLTEFGTSGFVDREAILLCPALHVAAFAAAVAMTCLVRHAIYAAVLSIGVIGFSIVVAAGIAWIATAVRSGTLPEWQEPTTTIVLSGLVGCFVFGTLLAWLAARNDWGQKSRY